MPLAPLEGYRIGITAERRRHDLARLLQRLGATTASGPAMSTRFLHDEHTLRTVSEALIASPPTLVVATTGIGMRAWIDAAHTWGIGDELLDALSVADLVARGPKAAAAASSAGLDVAVQIESEQLAGVGDHLGESGLDARRVAVQLMGDDELPLCDELAAAGTDVVRVPVYRWEPPLDPAPALRLVSQACAGELDALVFTSAPALERWFDLAAEAGSEHALLDALESDVMVACVGPVCAAAARARGVADPVAPVVGRMGTLVRAVRIALETRRRALEVEGVPLVVQGSAVAVADAPVVLLPPRERRVFDVMAARPGVVVPRSVLLQRGWGPDVDVHAVEVAVGRLRRRFTGSELTVEAVRGRGYRLAAARHVA